MTDDWCEKYRPNTLDEVVGNEKGKERLREWAESWEGVPQRRGVIISGSPGIGKTSAALALANDMGWGVVEMNASDKRDYDSVKDIAGVGAINQTFGIDGSFNPRRRRLIILDEADNLFGSEDRGGVRAIAEVLEGSLQPIVMVVNDYYSLVSRSAALRSLALQVEFKRPSKRDIANLLSRICEAEGVKADREALALLAENCSGDIRGAIRDLQLLALSPRFGRDEVLSLGTRDREEDVFRALAGVFKAKSAEDAKEAFQSLDESPDRFLLWIDENLPAEYKKPADMQRGFHFVSRSDLFLSRSRRRQVYSLWSYAIDLMTAGIATAKEEPYRGFTRYRFPSYLRKLSSAKMAREMESKIIGKIDEIWGRGEKNFGLVRELAKRDPEAVAGRLKLEDGEISYLLNR